MRPGAAAPMGRRAGLGRAIARMLQVKGKEAHHGAAQLLAEDGKVVEAAGRRRQRASAPPRKARLAVRQHEAIESPTSLSGLSGALGQALRLTWTGATGDASGIAVAASGRVVDAQPGGNLTATWWSPGTPVTAVGSSESTAGTTTDVPAPPRWTIARGTA